MRTTHDRRRVAIALFCIVLLLAMVAVRASHVAHSPRKHGRSIAETVLNLDGPFFATVIIAMFASPLGLPRYEALSLATFDYGLVVLPRLPFTRPPPVHF